MEEKSRSRWGELLGLVLLCCAPLVAFAALDQRVPNDHDHFYTAGIGEIAARFQTNDLLGRLGAMTPLATQGNHPPVSHLGLLLWLAIFGVSRLAYATANLPFVVALVVGSWGAARRLVPGRAALLLAGAMSWLPFLLCYSRKRDPFFHIAALAPLGLWAALVILDDARAGRTRRGPWLAFVAVGVLRLHTHLVAGLDVAVTAALVAGISLGVAPAATRRTIVRRLAECLAITLATCSWLLGFWDGADSGPRWSLARYWTWRSDYLVGEPSRGLAAAGARIGREWLRWHLMPGAVATLFAPGAVATIGWWRRDPGRRAEQLFLALVLLIQVPVLWWVLVRGASVVDFSAMVLAPALLCGAALWSVLPAGAVRASWVLAVIAVSLWAAVAPLAAGAWGPDPIVDRAAYRTGPLAAFAEIDTGRNAARHIPSTTPDPLTVLLDRVHRANPDGETATFDGHELWLDDPARCEWVEDQRANHAIGNNWPALFEGLGNLDWITDGSKSAGASVAYLQVPGLDAHQLDFRFAGATPVLDRAQACIDAARPVLAASLGVPVDEIEVLQDPAQSLRTMEWFTPSEYLRVVLVRMGDPPRRDEDELIGGAD